MAVWGIMEFFVTVCVEVSNKWNSDVGMKHVVANVEGSLINISEDFRLYVLRVAGN